MPSHIILLALNVIIPVFEIFQVLHLLKWKNAQFQYTWESVCAYMSWSISSSSSEFLLASTFEIGHTHFPFLQYKKIIFYSKGDQDTGEKYNIIFSLHLHLTMLVIFETLCTIRKSKRLLEKYTTSTTAICESVVQPLNHSSQYLQECGTQSYSLCSGSVCSQLPGMSCLGPCPASLQTWCQTCGQYAQQSQHTLDDDQKTMSFTALWTLLFIRP